MIIDVHAHCIPESFRSWLEHDGERVGAAVVETAGGRCVQYESGPRTGTQFQWPSLSDTDARIAAMDRMGIDVQLMAGWADLSGYEIDPAHCIDYTRAHNESLAEVAATAPGRLRPVGTVPLQSPEAAVAMMAHALDDLGMAGLQLATRVGGDPLDMRDLEPFWAAAAARGVLLILHPVRPLEGVDLTRFFLDNTIGRPAETSVALAGLIMSGVFERHPGLVICAVHGGGFVPFQAGRLDRSYREMSAVTGLHLTRPPSAYMENVIVDTIVHDPTTLEYLARRLGADHLALGTDYPFPMGDDDPVGMVRGTVGLTEAERELILGGNIARMLP